MIKKLVFLLLIPSLSSASCKVSDILSQIRPGSQWVVSGEDFSTVVWLSTQTIPSLIEVQQALTDCRANEVSLKQQLQNDLFNLQLSTNTVVQKLPALLDLLKLKGLLQ